MEAPGTPRRGSEHKVDSEYFRLSNDVNLCKGRIAMEHLLIKHAKEEVKKYNMFNPNTLHVKQYVASHLHRIQREEQHLKELYQKMQPLRDALTRHMHD